MADKITVVREYILGELESGAIAGGDKLPGARELSERLGISLPMVQNAFSSLVRDGILESVSRSGTFVRHDWRERILPGSFNAFRQIWSDLVTEFRSSLPGIQVLHSFEKGMFEIRTTVSILHDRNEYLNLAPLLDEVYPDQSAFFDAPFKSFRAESGTLYGIPLIFSPRVICYNPSMLARYGIPEPKPRWSFDDFAEMIRELRKSLQPKQIFNWGGYSFFWMNFIFRAGGSLIGNGEVKINHPRTLEGIFRTRQLFEALQVDEFNAGADYAKRFRAGECAFMLGAREEVDFQSATPWKSVPLPLIPGGEELTAQATDLLCIRRHNGDLELARNLIRTMLSEPFQDRLGALRYGIPIRKTSAIKSFDSNDPRDVLFLSEMTRISADYNIDSPELNTLINNGICEILYNGADPYEVTAELATALKLMLRLRHFTIRPGPAAGGAEEKMSRDQFPGHTSSPDVFGSV